jgi:NMD protein affecting ribosome stability and mRNA decay
LQKVKLVDAGFIWTEPHSKRLKVKLTIQAEVFNGTILQQGFVVEFIVENHMCLECNRANANPNSWTACAQVGGRVVGVRCAGGGGGRHLQSGAHASTHVCRHQNKHEGPI